MGAFAGELCPTRDAAEASAAVMAKEQVEVLAAQAPPQYHPPQAQGGGAVGSGAAYRPPPPPSNNPPEVKIQKAARACISHLKDGRPCMNGDACQFSHDPQDI